MVSPEASIDYRRKRGMLEEINRAARDIEEEETAERKAAEESELEQAGPVEEPGTSSRGPGGGVSPAGGPPDLAPSTTPKSNGALSPAFQPAPPTPGPPRIE